MGGRFDGMNPVRNGYVVCGSRIAVNCAYRTGKELACNNGNAHRSAPQPTLGRGDERCILLFDQLDDTEGVADSAALLDISPMANAHQLAGIASGAHGYGDFGHRAFFASRGEVEFDIDQ